MSGVGEDSCSHTNLPLAWGLLRESRVENIAVHCSRLCMQRLLQGTKQGRVATAGQVIIQLKHLPKSLRGQTLESVTDIHLQRMTRNRQNNSLPMKANTCVGQEDSVLALTCRWKVQYTGSAPGNTLSRAAAIAGEWSATNSKYPFALSHSAGG
jgi:hypothetical protein